MKEKSGILHFRFSLIFIVIFVVFYTSCSQNIPDITYTNYSIVFTFEDELSTPKARLSLFIENDADVRRCERINLYSYKSNYVWNTRNVQKIAAGDFQWAGNVNFVVPDGENIPQGTYEITIINADNEEAKSSMNVVYDKKIYDYTANEFMEKMGNQGSVNFAIFDANNVLLYFGEKTEDLQTKGDIFNTFPEATVYQDIWLSYDKTVICILPENKL